jgi:hypothetical protein
MLVSHHKNASQTNHIQIAYRSFKDDIVKIFENESLQLKI